MRLAGKIAVITGAGGDIGRATALRFAQEGAKVAVSDVREHACEETAQAIRNAGGNAIAFRADVTKADDLQQLALNTREAFGRATIVCNSASAAFEEPRVLAEIPETDFRATLSVNLKGAWMVIKHLAPAMIEAGGGSIVTIGSTAAFAGCSTAGSVASSAAVVALTRNAAVQLAKHGIRVNVVCAGAAEAPLGVEANAEWLERGSALRRLATPEEIASMALFLASDEASYSTGSTFMVDGGLMAIRSGMTVK